MVTTRDWRSDLVATLQHAEGQRGLTTSNPVLSVLHINGGILIRPRQTDGEPVNAQPLTEREKEVLSLVAEGYSNRELRTWSVCFVDLSETREATLR